MSHSNQYNKIVKDTVNQVIDEDHSKIPLVTLTNTPRI